MSLAIRLAKPVELEVLPVIEIKAATLISDNDLPPHLKNTPTSIESFQLACSESRLWVAEKDSTVVGFLLASFHNPYFHIDEIDVDPEYGRQGIGREMMTVVLTQAKDLGYEQASLTTFVHIPWNAPFYQSLGFSTRSKSIPEFLIDRLKFEDSLGLKNRVAMTRVL